MDSVSDLQAHSSAAVEDPATGWSEISVSFLLSFFGARGFLRDFCGCGVDRVASRVFIACADASVGAVSTATGIAVVGTKRRIVALRQKTCRRLQHRDERTRRFLIDAFSASESVRDP